MLGLNVPLMVFFPFLSGNLKRKLEFPSPNQEDRFFEKVALGDEALQVSNVQQRVQVHSEGSLEVFPGVQKKKIHTHKNKTTTTTTMKSALSNYSGTRIDMEK